MKQITLTPAQWQQLFFKLNSGDGSVEDLDNNISPEKDDKKKDTTPYKPSYTEPKDKKRDAKTKKSTQDTKKKSQSGKIIVTSATSKRAYGTYLNKKWKASNIDGHWKIFSQIDLDRGVKSTISRHINNHLEKHDL